MIIRQLLLLKYSFFTDTEVYTVSAFWGLFFSFFYAWPGLNWCMDLYAYVLFCKQHLNVQLSFLARALLKTDFYLNKVRSFYMLY